MMKLRVLASSSAGNGYVLQGDTETLLLEAGVPLSAVRKQVDDFRTVVGCLVSHEHGDHARYIDDYLHAGIPVYAHPDVFSARGIDHYNALPLDKFATVTIGSFTVMPCPANHDVPCYAYFIHHEAMGDLAFITDSHDFAYAMKGVRHLMIECNWSEECLQKAVDEKRTPWFVAKRVRDTHMSLRNAIGYIRDEVSPEQLSEIIMLHLSHENSDPEGFSAAMENAFQRPVYVAQEGLEVELNK